MGTLTTDIIGSRYSEIVCCLHELEANRLISMVLQAFWNDTEECHGSIGQNHLMKNVVIVGPNETFVTEPLEGSLAELPKSISIRKFRVKR